MVGSGLGFSPMSVRLVICCATALSFLNTIIFISRCMSSKYLPLGLTLFLILTFRKALQLLEVFGFDAKRMHATVSRDL